MVANTETVAPPSTQEGMVVSKEENLGRIPAINKITADSPRTTRLTTLVVTTIPTFWLKVAVGSPPRSAPRILEIPYPKIPPFNSVSVGMRSMEPVVVAEKSPMA